MYNLTEVEGIYRASKQLTYISALKMEAVRSFESNQTSTRLCDVTTHSMNWRKNLCIFISLCIPLDECVTWQGPARWQWRAPKQALPDPEYQMTFFLSYLSASLPVYLFIFLIFGLFDGDLSNNEYTASEDTIVCE
jgi:hypothetical protein